jgi:hypothetical protein
MVLVDIEEKITVVTKFTNTLRHNDTVNLFNYLYKQRHKVPGESITT